jgi:hypothetical protein
LSANERLVGWATAADAELARDLLPAGAKAIPVALDPAQPLPGHAAAWEALDLVVFDATGVRRIDPAQLAALVACGVTVAVRSAERPPSFAAWPWRRAGECWTLKLEPAGPTFDRGDAVTTAGFYEAAYLPVSDWQAGWTWAFRRRIALVGGVCCVLILGLAIWRPPLAALWVAVLAGVMCWGIGTWSGLHLPIQQAAGEVIVLHKDAGLTQTDGWTYQTSPYDERATLKWVDVMRPVFASRRGMDDFWMTLNCRTDGQPAEFCTQIPANRKVAFVARSAGPRAPRTTPVNPIVSPLKEMAERLYTPTSGRVLGELTVTPASGPAYGTIEVQEWNAVVLEK